MNDSQVSVKWYNLQKTNKQPISKERLRRTFKKSTELLLSLKKKKSPSEESSSEEKYKEMMAEDICTVMQVSQRQHSEAKSPSEKAA